MINPFPLPLLTGANYHQCKAKYSIQFYPFKLHGNCKDQLNLPKPEEPPASHSELWEIICFFACLFVCLLLNLRVVYYAVTTNQCNRQLTCVLCSVNWISLNSSFSMLKTHICKCTDTYTFEFLYFQLSSILSLSFLQLNFSENKIYSICLIVLLS